VHDDLWSGRLSVVIEDLVHAFEEKIRENTIHHYVTFPAFSSNFTVTSQNCFLINLSFGNCVHTGCRRCLRKNTKRQASTLDFLTQYSEEGENFLNHVVTGNETWV